jgi:hypothetical protein
MSEQTDIPRVWTSSKELIFVGSGEDLRHARGSPFYGATFQPVLHF